MKRKGLLFVVSGPSGCGKTTLCEKLLRKRLRLINSVSATTRPPRRGERRGRDYLYLTEKEFYGRLKNKGFLEHAKTLGHYYGTPKAPLLGAIRKGKDILLNIDVKGAAQIKRTFKKAVLIFILPPTFKELKNRLLKRSSDSASQIKKRLKLAHKELRSASRYDYAVVNDRLENAVDKLAAIITAERCRLIVGRKGKE